MGEEQIVEFMKTKRTAKENLCGKLSFDEEMPLIGLIIDQPLEKEYRQTIEKFLEGTAALNVEIVVAADTDLDSFSHPHVHHIPYSEKNRKELLQACDMMVALPFNNLDEMLLNGVVPIVCEEKGAKDYNPNHETGNSFVYGKIQDADHWKIFAATVRALETFKFPYDWKSIVINGIDGVKS